MSPGASRDPPEIVIRYPAEAILLAISETSDVLSFCGQVVALGLAAIIGRFWLKSRNAIWVVSFLGAIGAMVAKILVDGQAAFLLILFSPMIYVFAVVGRKNLDLRSKHS
jgi:hypothetical protein